MSSLLAATPTPEAPPHTGGLLLLIDGTAGLLTVAALGIVLLLVLIIKVRLQPFVALLAVSIAVGLSAGLSVTELFGTVQRSTSVSMIESGMGGILGHVAIIIGLGTMLGAILEVSGGAEALSARLLNLFGEKRAPLAMGLTGLIFGIPVFFDVGIFVLAPIVYAAAKRSGKSILLYAMPLLAGLSMTHAFLPPHPGPVAAAGLFKVDLGWVILMGVIVGIPAVLAAWAYAAWIGKRLFVPVPQDMVEAADEAKAAVAAERAARRAAVGGPTDGAAQAQVRAQSAATGKSTGDRRRRGFRFGRRRHGPVRGPRGAAALPLHGLPHHRYAAAADPRRDVLLHRPGPVDVPLGHRVLRAPLRGADDRAADGVLPAGHPARLVAQVA
jgi:GntP family gluconate:H+ symporter